MNKFKGFTLIELMIVISIIGILASVVIPAMQGFDNPNDVEENSNPNSERY